MSYGPLLHAELAEHAEHDHRAGWPTRAGHRALVTAEPTLAASLARCGAAGDFTSAEALDAVAACARRATRGGHPPAQVATIVRRSLAAAAPAAMTVVTFETVARTLVRHALQTLLAD